MPFLFMSIKTKVTAKNYEELKYENDQLIKHRDYHYEVAKEFLAILNVLNETGETWVTLRMIEQLYYHAMLSLRVVEYGIICHQISVGMIGINISNHENLYQMYFILSKTAMYLAGEIKEKYEESVVLNRSSTINQLARKSQELIEKIFAILQHEEIQQAGPRISKIVGYLQMANKNLNLLLVLV